MNKIYIITLTFLINLYPINLWSQCAMCKAAVESNLEAGGVKGAGLNEGILYLMAMPYLVIIIFGIFWYLQNRKQQHSSN